MTPPHNIKKQQTALIDRSSIWKLAIPFCHFISHYVFIGSEKISVDSVFDAYYHLHTVHKVRMLQNPDFLPPMYAIGTFLSYPTECTYYL